MALPVGRLEAEGLQAARGNAGALQGDGRRRPGALRRSERNHGERRVGKSDFSHGERKYQELIIEASFEVFISYTNPGVNID